MSASLLRSLLGSSALIASGLLASACVTVQSTAGDIPALTGNGLEGQSVADLTLAHFPDGTPHPLSEDLGQVVLLDIWATYCAPCKEALPMMSDLAKEYGARGLRVYAVSVDEDQRKIPRFLERVNASSLQVLLDPGGKLAESRLQMGVLPSTVLIDRKGVVRQVHQGFAPEFLQRYQSEIEELLAEKVK